MLAQDIWVLNDRYRLLQLVHANSDHEIWEAADQLGATYLVKAWPYPSRESTLMPGEIDRALWDIELRHLFRMTSSPEARSRLVVLQNAGINPATQHFMLVLESPGLTPLDRLLGNRASCSWLTELSDTDVRTEVWKGILNLALGLKQIHEHQMLHGAITPVSVFLNVDEGPQSMRLGGFEWTVRIASAVSRSDIPRPSVLPPDLHVGHSARFSFEADWFSFGVLIAQLFAPGQSDWSILDARQAYHEMVSAVEKSSLFETERHLLRRLLDRNPFSRLTRDVDIIHEIERTIRSIDRPPVLRESSYLALVCHLGVTSSSQPTAFTRAICEHYPDIDPLHVEGQRALIEADLKHPRLILLPSGTYVLAGLEHRYTLAPYRPLNDRSPPTWEVAYSSGFDYRRYGSESTQLVLQRPRINVYTLTDAVTRPDNTRRHSVSWEPYLPAKDREKAAKARLDRVHEFLRISNQIEVLFADAELFAYELVSSKRTPIHDTVTITQRARQREPLEFARKHRGIRSDMIEFLYQEENEQSATLAVYLGDDDSIDIGRPDERQLWHVVAGGFDFHSRTVTLTRPRFPTAVLPPTQGYLRTEDHNGQVELIKRRKLGIDKLATHYYLLQALLAPNLVHIDSGEENVPRPIDPSKIDPSKCQAIHKIWRGRPIFALQGPPGTGKTTLVANLLGQIFDDDPVAQVLVTAQAHPAVDVLRRKVKTETFGERGAQPLAVRLNSRKKDDPDAPERVTRRTLDEALRELSDHNLSALQTEWIMWMNSASAALARGDREAEGASDFEQLIERSANITYCTTTARALAQLIDRSQSFDWAIIEEAGKAHGFDLVLPLQVGHRWLLIGDHNQLPPYRYEDFRSALERLDDVHAHLWAVPDRRRDLIDRGVMESWSTYDDDDKDERREEWKSWLKTFAKVFDGATDAFEQSHREPLLSTMLDEQHRMHPKIAAIVSRAFYPDLSSSPAVVNAGRLKNGATVEVEGVPTAAVQHPLVAPAGLAGRPIVWVDIPLARDVSHRDDHTSEIEVTAIRRFLEAMQPSDDFLAALAENPDIVKPLQIAVLSPYRRQVLLLSRQLQAYFKTPRAWVARFEEEHGPIANTVDSFQGNQAQIVVVSLVRNHGTPPGAIERPFGFMDDPSRMNVLLSRAEQLLVLVGSWEFFRNHLEDVPANVEQYLGFWRILTNYLSNCFEDDSAIMIKEKDL